MAATPMAAPGAAPAPAFEPPFSPSPRPLDQIARLAALYDEARETARLANLIGRVPLLAAGLALGALASAFFAHAVTVPLATWLVLVGGGLIAMLRAWHHALAAPFERESLQSFSGDLVAICLYTGFAWGAGGFLALGAVAMIGPSLAFSAGASVFFALLLRRRDAALAFLLPATMLTGAAAFERAGTAGAPAALAALSAGLLIAAALYLADSLARRSGGASHALTPAAGVEI